MDIVREIVKSHKRLRKLTIVLLAIFLSISLFFAPAPYNAQVPDAHALPLAISRMQLVKGSDGENWWLITFNTNGVTSYGGPIYISNDTRVTTEDGRTYMPAHELEIRLNWWKAFVEIMSEKPKIEDATVIPQMNRWELKIIPYMNWRTMISYNKDILSDPFIADYYILRDISAIHSFLNYSVLIDGEEMESDFMDTADPVTDREVGIMNDNIIFGLTGRVDPTYSLPSHDQDTIVFVKPNGVVYAYPSRAKDYIRWDSGGIYDENDHPLQGTALREISQRENYYTYMCGRTTVWIPDQIPEEKYMAEHYEYMKPHEGKSLPIRGDFWGLYISNLPGYVNVDNATHYRRDMADFYTYPTDDNPPGVLELIPYLDRMVGDGRERAKDLFKEYGGWEMVFENGRPHHAVVDLESQAYSGPIIGSIMVSSNVLPIVEVKTQHGDMRIKSAELIGSNLVRRELAFKVTVENFGDSLSSAKLVARSSTETVVVDPAEMEFVVDAHSEKTEPLTIRARDVFEDTDGHLILELWGDFPTRKIDENTDLEFTAVAPNPLVIEFFFHVYNETNGADLSGVTIIAESEYYGVLTDTTGPHGRGHIETGNYVDDWNITAILEGYEMVSPGDFINMDNLATTTEIDIPMRVIVDDDKQAGFDYTPLYFAVPLGLVLVLFIWSRRQTKKRDKGGRQPGSPSTTPDDKGPSVPSDSDADIGLPKSPIMQRVFGSKWIFVPIILLGLYTAASFLLQFQSVRRTAGIGSGNILDLLWNYMIDSIIMPYILEFVLAVVVVIVFLLVKSKWSRITLVKDIFEAVAKATSLGAEKTGEIVVKAVTKSDE